MTGLSRATLSWNRSKKSWINSLQKEPKRKIIVFTEFADTADYLGEALQTYGLHCFQIHLFGRFLANKNTINANFNAGEKKNICRMTTRFWWLPMPSLKDITCIVQGTVINYDIPYNPTRIIQRIGRINRVNKEDVRPTIHL